MSYIVAGLLGAFIYKTLEVSNNFERIVLIIVYLLFYWGTTQ